jgi:hypothetical protein
MEVIAGGEIEYQNTLRRMPRRRCQRQRHHEQISQPTTG